MISPAAWAEPKRDVHRKIHLDASAFKQHSERSHGGDHACVHDWEGAGGLWTCALCGMVKTYEAWA